MSRRKTRLFWEWATRITFASATAITLLFGYWSLAPYGKDIITVTNNQILVVPRTVRAGEQVELVYTYCKNGKAENGIVSRYLKDEIIYFLPSIVSNVKEGCQDLVVPLDIPKNLPPDTYTYNAEITYKLNPIRSKTYYFVSESFNVTK